MTHLNELLTAHGGVLARRDHPQLQGSLDHWRRTGQLVSAHPGIYTAPDPTLPTRALAISRWDPDAVIVGAAAARLLWWPELRVPSITVASPQRWRPTPGVGVERRAIPPELVVERGAVRLASPALSTLDLIPELGGAVIDEALWRRVVSLDGLWQALAAVPKRPGNRLRRELLVDSRDEPWSEAERLVHRALRSASIEGWRTNYRIRLASRVVFADIAFPRQRLVIEIDGWEHHGNHRAFVEDRWRMAELLAHGWRVMPFAGSVTADLPRMIALVHEALRLTPGSGDRTMS